MTLIRIIHSHPWGGDLFWQVMTMMCFLVIVAAALAAYAIWRSDRY